VHEVFPTEKPLTAKAGGAYMVDPLTNDYSSAQGNTVSGLEHQQAINGASSGGMT